MSDTPPDRLAAHPSSPFHHADLLARGIGIRFKGVERTDVDEYCLSEGWVKVALGKKVDRKGAALTIKLTGPVEAWFLDVAGKGAGSKGAGVSDPGSAGEPPAEPAA